jgi:hypothetical protein
VNRLALRDLEEGLSKLRTALQIGGNTAEVEVSRKTRHFRSHGMETLLAEVAAYVADPPQSP